MKAIKQILDRISYFLWPYLIILLLLIFLKITFSKSEIYFYINRLHFSWGDYFFPKITELGSSAFAFIIVILLLLLVSYRSAFLLGSAYLFSAEVNFPLKFIFHSARPSVYFQELHSHIYFIPGVEVLSNYYSFPSGHTVCAFTGAVVATYLCKQKAWGIAFLLLALLVGYSRMYMSQHFFEDVFAGSVVGVVLTIYWLKICQRFHLLQKKSWQSSLLFTNPKS